MFETMRRNTKTIMWITAGAFVLLIFLAWGAEYQLGSAGRRASGIIGRVNGQPIYANIYNDRIIQAREGYRQQGQAVDEAIESQIRNEAWDALVQEILINQEIEKLGIQVSDQEVVQAIRNQPLPFLTQTPEFQTDGQFDYGKYLAALQDPNRDWIPLERYYRQDLPRQKLQQIVVSSVKISAVEVRRQYDLENEKTRVSYAFVPASQFPIDPDTIDDSELSAYYQKNRDDYRTDAQAKVDFVRIEKRPTAADTLAAKDLIRLAAKEAASGEEFGILVSAYSEAPTHLLGGPDAPLLTRDQITDPKVREAAFSLPVGQVSDVIEEPNGFHLLRVEERKIEGEQEAVRLSDIFVPFNLSGETLVEIQDRAISLAASARRSGGDLEAGLRETGYSDLSVGKTGPFSRKGFVPPLGRLGQMESFRDWVFNIQPREITLMDTPEATYIICLAERRPPGFAVLEEIRERVRSEYMSAQQSARAAERAEAILAAARGGLTLEQATAADEAASFDTTDEFARRGFARGLGNDPALMARIFAAPLGLIEEVIPTRRGAYVIEVLSRSEADDEAFASRREAIHRQLLQRRRAEVVNQWMEGLRSKAKIEDYRGEFEA